MLKNKKTPQLELFETEGKSMNKFGIIEIYIYFLLGMMRKAISKKKLIGRTRNEI